MDPDQNLAGARLRKACLARADLRGATLDDRLETLARVLLHAFLAIRRDGRQRGAKGVLVVTGPRSPNAGEVAPMTFDTAIAGSGIVAASVSGDVAAPLFAAAGKKLDDLEIGGAFDLRKETLGALALVESLAPPGKKVRMLLWSGNCNPDERAIGLVEDAGFPARESALDFLLQGGEPVGRGSARRAGRLAAELGRQVGDG